MAIDSLVGATALATGYRLTATVYFTSSGSFDKADYPGLKAIFVRVQGAGGGGASPTRTTNGQNTNARGGGGGGGYLEKMITDIESLAESETVTIGAGGAGGADTGTSDTPLAGSAGGDTTAFGLTGGGGEGGVITNGTTCASGGTVTGTADFSMRGGRGGPSGNNLSDGLESLYGHGGFSYLGGVNPTYSNSFGSSLGGGYGAGREGGKRRISSTGAASFPGGDGVVIVEVYS